MLKPIIVPPQSSINLALSVHEGNSFNSDIKARHMYKFKTRNKIDIVRPAALFLKMSCKTRVSNKVAAIGFKGELKSQ